MGRKVKYHASNRAKWVIGFLVAVLFLFWPKALVEIFPLVLQQSLPSTMDLIPGLLALILLLKIRCPYSRLIGFIWLAWYFIGTLNTIASSVVYGSYYSDLKLQNATLIYFTGCIFYFLGMLIYEKFFAHNSQTLFGLASPKIKIQGMVGVFLIAFPFAWFFSIYFTLGYIPILSAGSIVESMYEIAYGPLYAYGAWIIISILYTGHRAMSTDDSKTRIFYSALTLAFILISMTDGKRAISMVAMGGLIGLSLRVLKQKTWSKSLPVFGYTMVGSYVGVLLLRVNVGNNNMVDLYSNMMLFGGEFRDYVYTVNFFNPGEIKNYSWAVSSMASMTNNLVMQSIGLNKAELVVLDSAHAWAAIWQTNFGIRTGILSELWFAYGAGAVPILLILGMVTGYVIKKIRTSRTDWATIFSASAFGLLFLNITSQSTFTFGILPTLFYLYLIMLGLDYLNFKVFLKVSVKHKPKAVL